MALLVSYSAGPLSTKQHLMCQFARSLLLGSNRPGRFFLRFRSLGELTSLFNAPRRSARGDASSALELFGIGTSLRQILTGADSDLAALRDRLLADKATACA